MRIAFLAALALALLVPLAGSAENPARCQYIATQIKYFDDMAQRAESLGNDVWVQRFDQHLSELKQRQKACPGYSDSEVAARQFQELAKLAARGALRFFTLGMGPFF
jgi:hypothetical protein